MFISIYDFLFKKYFGEEKSLYIKIGTKLRV